MCLYHIVRLERDAVEDDEPTRSRRNVLRRLRRSVGRSRFRCVVGLIAGFGERVHEVAVLGGWGEGAYCLGVGGRRNRVEEAHVADIVDIDLFFENNGESLAVEADSENGGRKCKFANYGCSL